MSKYDEVLAEMKAIHDAKNSDYGDSAHNTYEQFGLTSYLVRMHDKLNRATQLDREGNQQVQDEKIYDTLVDLANYAAMAAAEIKGDSEEPARKHLY